MDIDKASSLFQWLFNSTEESNGSQSVVWRFGNSTKQEIRELSWLFEKNGFKVVEYFSPDAIQVFATSPKVSLKTINKILKSIGCAFTSVTFHYRKEDMPLQEVFEEECLIKKKLLCHENPEFNSDAWGYFVNLSSEPELPQSLYVCASIICKHIDVQWAEGRHVYRSDLEGFVGRYLPFDLSGRSGPNPSLEDLKGYLGEILSQEKDFAGYAEATHLPTSHRGMAPIDEILSKREDLVRAIGIMSESIDQAREAQRKYLEAKKVFESIISGVE